MLNEGFPGGSDGKESACNAGDLSSVPGLGRSHGEGNGSPLQYSCLENPTDRGTWKAAVHGVAKSWTQLSDWTTTGKSKPKYLFGWNFYIFGLTITLFHREWIRGNSQCWLYQISFLSERDKGWERHRERTLRGWLTWLWVLACVKSVGQACRLEIQRADTTNQPRIPQSSRLGTQARFCVAVLRSFPSVFPKPQSFSEGL